MRPPFSLRPILFFLYSEKETAAPGEEKERDDQSLALDLRRMKVLDFVVFAGRLMAAIIKIACGA